MDITGIVNLIAASQLSPSLSDPLSVAKSEFLGRLGFAAPVAGQVFTRPNPYRDALRKARLYKESEFSMPFNTEALGLSNYGDAEYYSSNFGKYT